jgi:hypothetical protein
MIKKGNNMEKSEITLQTINDMKKKLDKIDAESLARKCGISKRKNRKLNANQLLSILVAMAPSSSFSLEKTAKLAGLYCNIKFSKQAMNKRLSGGIDKFLLEVATLLLQPLIVRVPSAKSALGLFRRVIVVDSTKISLPDRFFANFPGSSNQNKSTSIMKVQVAMDILSLNLPHLSISSFRRNDQAASPDILEIAKPGDLVLRDLGYFVLDTFRKMTEKEIYFISRYRHGTQIFTLNNQKQLDILEILKRQNFIDQEVLIGKKERLPVRFVAIPVPEDVANKRRRKANKDRDKRCNPSKEKKIMMGWTILITNVEQEKLASKTVDDIYRLRWTIEVLFKAWKTNLKLHLPSTASKDAILTSTASKLIFCILTQRFHAAIELYSSQEKHASILRVANIVADLSIIFICLFLKINTIDMTMHMIESHAFYEIRQDRINMHQKIKQLCLG